MLRMLCKPTECLNEKNCCYTPVKSVLLFRAYIEEKTRLSFVFTVASPFEDLHVLILSRSEEVCRLPVKLCTNMCLARDPVSNDSTLQHRTVGYKERTTQDAASEV